MKCMATGCDKHATRDMDFCLTHSDMQADYDKARIRQGKAIKKMKSEDMLLKGFAESPMGVMPVSSYEDIKFIPAMEPVESPFEMSLIGITDKLKETLLQKNKAYGASYAKSVDKYGKTVPLIRLSDKMNRLDSLILGEANSDDESVEDTLLDLAGYAVLELIRRGV